jgi:hypothetical protein
MTQSHHFTLPYEPRPYDAPLADWDPRCMECGKWPVDCLCNAEPETEEQH